MRINYRREIDGLRFLAVMPVILFHAGFEIFSGGYVGVDVFFVISGYLITNIILTDLDSKNFSLMNFYERRARRILPMLFVVIIICIILSWIILLPNEMKSFSKSLVAVSLFAANILFWRESSYFDAAADLKPLLHIWSLSLEEQYYVFFPIFLMILWRRGKGIILTILIIFFFISLTLSVWATEAKPGAAFFLLPTRLWEFLAGAFVAYYFNKFHIKKISTYASELGGWLGIALILFSVFTFNKQTLFPGLYALIPVLGSVLIIIFANEHNQVGKLLSNNIFVGIGLISYSAYLWHFPLFSFARHYGVSKSDAQVNILLLIITITFAYISWRFIEVPFKKKSYLIKSNMLIIGALGGIIIFAIGLFIYKNNGDVGQISNEQRIFLKQFDNELPKQMYFFKQGITEKYRIDCDFYDISINKLGDFTKIPFKGISESCFTKKFSDSKVIFIWGDSHAQQLYYGLNKVMPREFEILQVASSGCVASIKFSKSKGDYCEYSNWFALNTIKKIKPEIVIIGQNSGHNFSYMEKISDLIKGVGVGRVIFIGPTPHWNPSLPATVAKLLPNVPKRTFLGVDKVILDIDQELKLKSNKSLKLEYVSVSSFFCNNEGCLTHFDSDFVTGITSWDYGHLTPLASYKLSKDLLMQIIVGDNDK